MKTFLKTVALFLCTLICVSLCACNGVLIDDTFERKAYNNAVTSLFSALDSKDKEAIFNLFAPNIQRIDSDLKKQIDNLVSVYNGPVLQISDNILISGEETLGGGENFKKASATFPVRTEKEYYWCYLELVYLNEIDPDSVGIAVLDFYTADEFCILINEKGNAVEITPGLNVFASQDLEKEVRCINGFAYAYNNKARQVDLEEVKEFLKASKDFSEFKTRFGKPAAGEYDYYYQLPKENGKENYLEVVVDDEKIIGVHVTDDFGYIDTVFEP